MRSSGIWDPAGMIRVSTGAVDELEVTVADEVEEAHRRAGAGCQHDGAVRRRSRRRLFCQGAATRR